MAHDNTNFYLHSILLAQADDVQGACERQLVLNHARLHMLERLFDQGVDITSRVNMEGVCLSFYDRNVTLAGRKWLSWTALGDDGEESGTGIRTIMDDWFLIELTRKYPDVRVVHVSANLRYFVAVLTVWQNGEVLTHALSGARLEGKFSEWADAGKSMPMDFQRALLEDLLAAPSISAILPGNADAGTAGKHNPKRNTDR